MDPLPNYEELFWLFEAEPIRRPAGEPWPYTSVTFRTMRAGYDIEMEPDPGYHVVRLRLHAAGGGKLIDLELGDVLSVGVERIQDRECLRIDFPDDSPASTLWLQMKPDINLTWSHSSAP